MTATLIKVQNGWIVSLDGGRASQVLNVDQCYVFESTKSLAHGLPKIIDPDSAKAMLASMPKRGAKGRFQPK